MPLARNFGGGEARPLPRSTAGKDKTRTFKGGEAGVALSRSAEVRRLGAVIAWQRVCSRIGCVFFSIS